MVHIDWNRSRELGRGTVGVDGGFGVGVGAEKSRPDGKRARFQEFPYLCSPTRRLTEGRGSRQQTTPYKRRVA